MESLFRIEIVHQEEICPGCHIIYDSEKYMPKILKCGHTICLCCISKRTKACPKCNDSIKESASDLPTNLVISVKPMKGSLQDLQLQKCLLENMMQKNCRSFNKSQIFEDLNFTSPSSKKSPSPSKKSPSPSKKSPSPSKAPPPSPKKVYYTIPDIRRVSYQNDEEYINKIVAELLQGKKVWAFSDKYFYPSKGDFHYARLNYKDGKLYIHSLASDLPTMPSLIVHFRDLKDCLKINNFQTFINIDGNEIVCTIVSSSPLSYDFIYFCSGEGATSFKGMTTEIEYFADKHEDIIGLTIIKRGNSCKPSDFFLRPLPLETKEAFEGRLKIKMWKRTMTYPDPEPSRSEIIKSDGVVVASATLSVKALSLLSIGGEACVEDCGLMLLHSSKKQNTPVASEPLLT